MESTDIEVKSNELTVVDNTICPTEEKLDTAKLETSSTLFGEMETLSVKDESSADKVIKSSEVISCDETESKNSRMGEVD